MQAHQSSRRPSDGMADIRDLKSRGEKSPCGFDSRLGHPSFTSEEGFFCRQIRQIPDLSPPSQEVWEVRWRHKHTVGVE